MKVWHLILFAVGVFVCIWAGNNVKFISNIVS